MASTPVDDWVARPSLIVYFPVRLRIRRGLGELYEFLWYCSNPFAVFAVSLHGSADNAVPVLCLSVQSAMRKDVPSTRRFQTDQSGNRMPVCEWNRRRQRRKNGTTPAATKAAAPAEKNLRWNARCSRDWFHRAVKVSPQGNSPNSDVLLFPSTMLLPVTEVEELADNLIVFLAGTTLKPAGTFVELPPHRSNLL